MDKTLLEVLPLAIGAMMSPTGLLFVMMILSGKDKPKKKALDFVLGSTLLLVALGLLIFFTAKPIVNVTSHPDVTSSIIDIVLGCIMILIVVRSIFFKKEKLPKDNKKDNKPYLVVGFFYMLVNVSSLIPFIAAIKIIAVDKLTPLDDIFTVLIVIIITMLMVAFPVIISYVIPQKSENILGSISVAMSKNSTKITNAFFLLMAVYLIYHGVSRLI